ncbi:MAG: DNA repair protein RecO [Candidatus Margulisbacteria bacterium]|nr:DNA repair protein RecO [Candidatus Margulisiibacteriota bacterium]
MLIKLDAINLKTVPYSDSSLIVIVFSKELGKQSLLAKGVKKSKRSYGGKLQSFMHNIYTVSKKTGMAFITSVDTINPYIQISTNINKLSCAYECLAITYHTGQFNNPNPGIFDLTLKTLEQIEKAEKAQLALILENFKKQILFIEGILPRDEKKYNMDNLINQYIEHDLVKF